MSEKYYWFAWNLSWTQFKFYGVGNNSNPSPPPPRVSIIEPPLIISEVIPRSLRIMPSFGRTESSPKEPEKSFVISMSWETLTHSAPPRRGLIVTGAFWTQVSLCSCIETEQKYVNRYAMCIAVWLEFQNLVLLTWRHTSRDCVVCVESVASEGWDILTCHHKRRESS
jgi:hypothetical protein